MSQVLYGVLQHQDGFRAIVSELRQFPHLAPDFNQKIMSNIEEGFIFTYAKLFHSYVGLVTDTIADMECNDALLSDIWIHIIKIYKRIKSYQIHSDFRDHCLQTMNRFLIPKFNDDIYLVAFFLSPKHRRIACSMSITINKMMEMIIKLAVNNFKCDLISINKNMKYRMNIKMHLT